MHPRNPDKRVKFGILRNDSFHVSCFPNEIKTKEGCLGAQQTCEKVIYNVASYIELPESQPGETHKPMK